MDTVDNLIFDLLEWMGPRPRPYADVLEAWRTSCPRLPVWEEANDRGFIVRRSAVPLSRRLPPAGSTCGPTAIPRRSDEAAQAGSSA